MTTLQVLAAGLREDAALLRSRIQPAVQTPDHVSEQRRIVARMELAAAQLLVLERDR